MSLLLNPNLTVEQATKLRDLSLSKRDGLIERAKELSENGTEEQKKAVYGTLMIALTVCGGFF